MTISTLPPPTRRDPESGDEQFGRRIADPYRWLEHTEAAEVRAWIDAQNAWARSRLDALPGRDDLSRRMRALFGVEALSVPMTCLSPDTGARRCFYVRRSGDQQRASVWMRDEAGRDREVLAPDAEGGQALDWFQPSRSGGYLAYGVSRDGSEDSVLRVRDVTSGRDLDDVIPRARFCSLAWLAGDRSFLYTRYPPAEGRGAEEAWCDRAVLHHTLGNDPGADPFVWQGDATDFPSVHVSPDGAWAALLVYRGWDRNDLYLARLGDPEATPRWQPVFKGEDAIFDARFGRDALFVRTSAGAPRYRLLRLPLTAGGHGAAIPLVEEDASDVLMGFAITAAHVVLHYLADASSRLRVVDHAGVATCQVALDSLGSCREISAHPYDATATYDFMSFCRPATVFELDPASGRSRVWCAPAAPPLPAVDVTRLRARSADGTSVPMFVISRRGDRAAGPRPTLFIGYGGFNVAMLPKFEPASCTFVEAGGVLVVANLRGGGEFGSDWYQAGARRNKPRVFEDAIACAEELIRREITSPRQLGLLGESHASLVALAAMGQRPDLYRAAVCASPLADLLRFHLHGVGRLWVSEFGSPDDEQDHACLEACSPYHRALAGGPPAAAPSVLLTCGETDPRTAPMHARKMAAALQRWARPDRPVLLLSSGDRGHGFGNPLAMQIDEMVDAYSFLCAELGLDLRGARALPP